MWGIREKEEYFFSKKAYRLVTLEVLVHLGPGEHAWKTRSLYMMQKRQKKRKNYQQQHRGDQVKKLRSIYYKERA